MRKEVTQGALVLIPTISATLLTLVVAGVVLVLRRKKYVGYGWRLRYDATSKQIVIESCRPGSPADRESLRVPAILVAVDGQPVLPKDYAAYYAWTRTINPVVGETRTFLIREGTVARAIVLSPELMRGKPKRPGPPRYEPSESTLRDMCTSGGMVSRQNGDTIIIAAQRKIRDDVMETL